MNKTWILLAWLTITPAWAEEGSSVRGGGNDLVAAFVATAEDLLREIPFQPMEKKMLQKALKNAKITSVPVLLDGTKPVPHQNKLVAWGSENSIQLKEASDEGDSFEQMLEDGRPIAHIVVHELFRASGWQAPGGRSPDDQFEISIGAYHLNKRFDDSRPMLLAAECKVTACSEKGFDTEDGIGCRNATIPYQGAWTDGTLRVYRYLGRNKILRNAGLLSLENLGLPVMERAGRESLRNVRIVEKNDVLKVKTVEATRKMEFSLPLKLEMTEITVGKGRLPMAPLHKNGRLHERWVELNLSCQTDFPRRR